MVGMRQGAATGGWGWGVGGGDMSFGVDRLLGGDDRRVLQSSCASMSRGLGGTGEEGRSSEVL